MPKTADPALGRAWRTEKEIEKQKTETWLREHLPDWLDQMIHRLFLELENQLETVERASALSARDEKQATQQTTNSSGEDYAGRERHARTLASLERTLERLTSLEKQRAGIRAAHRMKGTDVKAELQRRVDRAIAREEAERNSERSQP